MFHELGILWFLQAINTITKKLMISVIIDKFDLLCPFPLSLKGLDIFQSIMILCLSCFNVKIITKSFLKTQSRDNLE